MRHILLYAKLFPGFLGQLTLMNIYGLGYCAYFHSPNDGIRPLFMLAIHSLGPEYVTHNEIHDFFYFRFLGSVDLDIICFLLRSRKMAN